MSVFLDDLITLFELNNLNELTALGVMICAIIMLIGIIRR